MGPSLRPSPISSSQRTFSARVDSHWRLVLLLIVSLAALVRLVYALQIRHSPIPDLWRGPETDMSFFVAWAKIISAGDWLTDQPLHPYLTWQRSIASLAEWNAWYGGKTFHQAPLYPYLLAVLLKLAGPTLWSVYVVQAIGSALTAAVLASISRRLFSPTAGLIAGVLTALYGTLIFYDFVVLRASLTVLSLAVAVWLLVQAGSHRHWWRWLAAGVVMGLAYLLRPNAALTIVLATIAVAWVFWRQWSRLATAWVGMFVGFGVCLIPLVVRNVAVGVSPLTSSSLGGSAFYLSNASGAPGTGWNVGPDYADVMRRTGGDVRAMLRETIASHSSVRGLAHLLIKKIKALAHYFETTNNASPYYAQRFSSLLRWASLPFWTVFSLGILGLVVTWPKRGQLIWLYVAILAPVLTILLFYQTSRLRLPIIVGLIPFAAAGIEWLGARRSNARLGIAAAVLLCVATRWPSNDDPPRIKARDYAAGANVMSRAGRHDRAIAEAREGVLRHGHNMRAWIAMVNVLARAGRTDQAASACDCASQAFPGSLYLRVRRAEIHIEQGQADHAIHICRELLRSVSGSQPVTTCLSKALIARGGSQDIGQAVRLARRAVAAAPDEPKSHLALANALAASGEHREAAEVIENGLKQVSPADPGRTSLELRLASLQGSTHRKSGKGPNAQP